MNKHTTNNFKQIVLDNTPLIDVRAPIEFEKGAFLGAINLPIMNNQDRHLVGTCYKEKGNEAATALGHQLVSGEVKASRIKAWVDYIDANPKAMIYCFRGGSRSRIAQEWISCELGHDILRLEGGYKAFRGYLINVLENPLNQIIPLFLSGLTGSGKTLLLKQLDLSIDLEGLANHRGSSFGRYLTPQPTQINFENDLAYAFIRHEAKRYKHMILEDEGRHIGHNFIPKPLLEYLSKGDLILMEVPLEERIQITLKEYVIDSQASYIKVYGEKGLSCWFDYISSSITKLKKRLGGERFRVLHVTFCNAYKMQLVTQSYTPHEEWIHLLLTEYYDPMYTYQLARTHRKVAFRGNTDEILQYLKELESHKITHAG